MLKLVKLFGSLKLTVTLLAFSMALVFFGTLDQVQLGIHAVQQRYFESFFVIYPYNPQGIGFLPLPGGYLIGGLLVINLLCAHYLHYKRGWKNFGITMIHVGILLLLISGFVTSAVQRESHMAITEGDKANFSFTQRDNELVLIDTSAAEINTEVAIPRAFLSPDKPITHEALPFSIHVKHYHKNANLYPQVTDEFFKQAPTAYHSAATRGVGKRMNIAVHPLPVNYSEDGINTATAVVDLRDKSGQSIGTWLVSNVFDSNRLPPQTFEYGGKSWEIALRFKRYYKPYWIELHDMTHDVYPGTQIPKNFSSKVTIYPFDNSQSRDALIYMNHPLRYDGLTYYQSGVNNVTQGTVLQVVKNPGWLLPYISILLVGLGMCWQFGAHLISYVNKSKPSTKKGSN